MANAKLRNICVTGLCAALMLMPSSAAWADDLDLALVSLKKLAAMRDAGAVYTKQALAEHKAGDNAAACKSLTKGHYEHTGMDAEIFKLHGYRFDEPTTTAKIKEAMVSFNNVQIAMLEAIGKIC